MTHDWMLFGAIVTNIIITSAGFVRIIISYEHRFTKLETQIALIMEHWIKDR